MRRSVVRALRRAGADPVPIENALEAGTPDVESIFGWMELKQVRRWPPRGGEPDLRHFTQAQRRFLRRRSAAGGRSWLLLQVGRTWLLFDGGVAATRVGLGDSTGEETRNLALAEWRRDREEQLERFARATIAGT